MCGYDQNCNDSQYPQNTFKGTIMYDFILSKTQHEAFIARWKAAHAAKETFTAADYLTHAILSAAVPDAKAKARKAFSPCKRDNPTDWTFKNTIDGLLYWAKKNSVPWFHDCKDISQEQVNRFIAILEELKKGE